MVSPLLLAVLLSALYLPSCAAYNETHPCETEGSILAACKNASHIAIKIGEVNFGGSSAISLSGLTENLEYFSIRRSCTFEKVSVSEISFPRLKRLEGDLNIFYNPNLMSVSFPRLEVLKGALNIFRNPNLMSVHMPSLDPSNSEASISIKWNPKLSGIDISATTLKLLVIEYNNKMKEEQLQPYRDVSIDIQEEGDCDFEAFGVSSLTELADCKKIAKGITFPMNVSDVDFQLDHMIEVQGCVVAKNTNLRTLDFLNETTCTQSEDVTGNNYLCDESDKKFKDAKDNCGAGCNVNCTLSVSNCEVLLDSLSYDSSITCPNLTNIVDYLQRVRIVGTDLTSLEGVLGSAERIISPNETALEIVDNGNLTSMDLSKLKVVRSKGKIKVRIMRNSFKLTLREKEDFLRNTGLKEEEVEIDFVAPTTSVPTTKPSNGNTKSTADAITSLEDDENDIPYWQWVDKVRNDQNWKSIEDEPGWDTSAQSRWSTWAWVLSIVGFCIGTLIALAAVFFVFLDFLPYIVEMENDALEEEERQRLRREQERLLQEQKERDKERRRKRAANRPYRKLY